MQSENNQVTIWAFPNSNNRCLFIRLNENSSIEEISSSDIGMADVLSISSYQQLKLPEDLTYQKDSLVELIAFFEASFHQNFSSTLATVSAACLCLHFPYLKLHSEGVPIPIVIGDPGTYKTTTCSLAMAALGIESKCQDSTYNGILKVLSQEELPIWWEDLDDLQKLEKISMMTYNKGMKVTANNFGGRNKVPSSTKAMPLVTSNGLFKGANPVSAERTLGRVVLIPFLRTPSEKKTVQNALDFDSLLQDARINASRCFLYMLQMKKTYSEYRRDQNMLNIINNVLDGFDLDERHLKNYTLLLVVMAKILKDTDHGDDATLQILKDFFIGNRNYVSSVYKSQGELGKTMLERAFFESLEDPKARKWIVFVNARGCACGAVIVFSLKNLLQSLNFETRKELDFKIIRSYVEKNGCIKASLKYSVDGVVCAGIHIQEAVVHKDLLQSLKDSSPAKITTMAKKNQNHTALNYNKASSSTIVKPEGSKTVSSDKEIEEDSSSKSMRLTIISDPSISFTRTEVKDVSPIQFENRYLNKEKCKKETESSDIEHNEEGNIKKSAKRDRKALSSLEDNLSKNETVTEKRRCKRTKTTYDK